MNNYQILNWADVPVYIQEDYVNVSIVTAVERVQNDVKWWIDYFYPSLYVSIYRLLCYLSYFLDTIIVDLLFVLKKLLFH